MLMFSSCNLKFYLFADDTKLFRKTKQIGDKQKLQDDIDKLVRWFDLGVSMNANMKVSEQCRIAASKGNQVLGMIRRNITYKEEFIVYRHGVHISGKT